MEGGGSASPPFSTNPEVYMKIVTIAFTDGSSLSFRGEPIIDPRMSIIIHNHQDDTNIGVNWDHIFFYQVEEEEEEEE